MIENHFSFSNTSISRRRYAWQPSTNDRNRDLMHSTATTTTLLLYNCRTINFVPTSRSTGQSETVYWANAETLAPTAIYYVICVHTGKLRALFAEAVDSDQSIVELRLVRSSRRTSIDTPHLRVSLAHAPEKGSSSCAGRSVGDRDQCDSQRYR